MASEGGGGGSKITKEALILAAGVLILAACWGKKNWKEIGDALAVLCQESDAIRKARTPRLLKTLFTLNAKSYIKFTPEACFLNAIFEKQNENEFQELLIFIHGMSYCWCDGFDENWKTVSVSFENRCSKCSKGPPQIPSRGNFFQQGKLFHCVWDEASKWKLSLSHYIRWSFWNVGQKQAEGTSKYVAWSMRVVEEADFWWWSPLRMMFCSSFSGDISGLYRAISKYVPPIGQRYPALATHLIQCSLWYLTFF